MLKDPVPYHSYFSGQSLLFDDLEETMVSRNCTHYASLLLGKELHDETELETALQKAIMAANLRPTRPDRSCTIAAPKQPECKTD